MNEYHSEEYTSSTLENVENNLLMLIYNYQRFALSRVIIKSNQIFINPIMVPQGAVT
jgi:hypothetical protein